MYANAAKIGAPIATTSPLSGSAREDPNWSPKLPSSAMRASEKSHGAPGSTRAAAPHEKTYALPASEKYPTEETTSVSADGVIASA